MGANLGRDHTVWQPEPDEISNRLGWLRSPQEMPLRPTSEMSAPSPDKGCVGRCNEPPV